MVELNDNILLETLIDFFDFYADSIFFKLIQFSFKLSYWYTLYAYLNNWFIYLVITG